MCGCKKTAIRGGEGGQRKGKMANKKDRLAS